MQALALLSDPSAWAALVTLVLLEIVLGIDNLVFVAILSNKLPADQQQRARRIGLLLALALRLALLTLIGWIVTLQQPLIDLGLSGQPGPHGEPSFETAFSGRDFILIAGGLFLLWKATKEIHHTIDPEPSGELLDHKGHGGGVAAATVASFGGTIVQIIALDLVFSIDSILTAVGMTDEIVIMIAAVVILLFGSLFPNLVPSTIDPAYSITVYNGSSSPYTLKVMTWAAAVFTPLVLVYQAWTYWVFRKRVFAASIPPSIGLPMRRVP